MSGRVNLMSPEVRANPYPVYAELRRSAPVCQVDPGGLWAITRYEDVLAAFKNTAVFSSEGVKLTTQTAWLPHNPFSESMIVMDPPQHGRLRALVTKAFGPGSINRMEARIRQFSQSLVDRMPEGSPFDFVEAFSMPLPASVIGELFGLDPSLTQRYKRWAHDLTSVSATTPQDFARHESIRNTVAEMEQYLMEVVEARRREPREDMVSELLSARVNGEALTDRELMSFLFLLLVAGLDTTVQLISHCMRTLIERPELAGRLREAPALVPRFVEEALRHEPPLHGTVRVTTQEVEMHGVRIPAGARVILMVGSANHDDTHFAGAERFELDREGNNNLPFGHGIHFCLGAQLSRLEGRIALDTLLSRFGRFTAAGPVTWNTSLTVRGPRALPIVAHAA